jgi:hypothetical protein
MSLRRSRRGWNRNRGGLAIAGAAWLLGAACAGEHRVFDFLPRLLAADCGGRYLADVESGFQLTADTSVPGSSPPLVFEMFIPGGSIAAPILLTHDVVITLPAGFGFAGFGTAGTSVGSWDFDCTPTRS